MTPPQPRKHDPLESLVELGRRLVAASTGLPREALRFLGQPALTRRGPEMGASPGAMVVPEDSPAPRIRVITYEPEAFDEREVADPRELAPLIEAGGAIAWIDVEGFGDQSILEAVGKVLGIHPLAMADVVHVPQRPKVEMHDGRWLVVSQMARVSEGGTIDLEQVSLVLGHGFVASFQERPGDIFDPVRERIRAGSTRIRQLGPDYLLYSLLDAVIDGYFPVVEALGGIIDALEEEVVEHPTRTLLARIHSTRRTLLTLHRVQWRQRDAIGALLREEGLPFTDGVMPFLRDAHDHAFQTLDALATYRDMLAGLMDLHLSNASHRMNEVMKTLTIVATIFIPLTFLAGVYGMNFEHMPELHWRWSYPAVWLVMAGLAVGLILWFRRRGWLGGD